MKTIVAGSRKGADYNTVLQAMQDAPWDINTVISGTAKGVDTLGEQVAKNYGIPVKRYPADWRNLDVPGVVVKHNIYGAYNAIAGHQRNTLMAENADALVAIWDGKSKGTKNMIDTAKTKNLKIYIHLI